MPLNKAKGKMFKSVGWTWNPVVGCIHECDYCWAKALRNRWNKTFRPTIQESAFKDKWPNDGTIIFVGSMGDLFCEDYIFEEAIPRIFEKMREAKNQKFLLQTKNPSNIYENWLSAIWDLDTSGIDIFVGTTIETNRDTPWSHAPHPLERFVYLRMIAEETPVGTFLSYEPLAEFDLEAMITIARELSPVAVEIGLENYTNHVPKPSENSIKTLLQEFKHHNIPYVLKENLQSLEESVNGN